MGYQIIDDPIRTRIIALLSQDTHQLSQAQIAKLTGVSPSKVNRIAQEVRPHIQEAHSTLAKYQKLLRDEVQLKQMAKLRVALAFESDNENIQHKSLSRLEELHGIITPKEAQKRDLHKALDGKPQPFFLFPEGSQPILNVSVEPHAAMTTPKNSTAQVVDIPQLTEKTLTQVKTNLTQVNKKDGGASADKRARTPDSPNPDALETTQDGPMYAVNNAPGPQPEGNEDVIDTPGGRKKEK